MTVYVDNWFEEAEDSRPPRILITGSQTWTDEAAIAEALKAVYEPGAILVSGHCPRGADAIAERIWTELGGTVEEHPAEWRPNGALDRGAGFKRNAAMVKSHPDTAVAFIKDKSHGSTHCAGLAQDAGIPTDIHRPRAELVAEADYAAGLAFKAGEHLQAARLVEEARERYPDQPDLWAKRADAIHAAMRAANEPMRDDGQPTEELVRSLFRTWETEPAEGPSLVEVVSDRLTAAGVKPDDPEVIHLRAWNELQYSRAFPVVEPQSVPVPELTFDEREATP
jgi:hypothetical protein